MRTIVVYTMLLSFFTSLCQAQVPGMSHLTLPGGGGGSEYFVGRIQGKPLITVYLLSGVHIPGVYHIPIQTDLGELLAYAGGVNESADVNDISIRTRTDKAPAMKHYDLENIVDKNQPLPALEENDTVHIGTRTDRTQRTLLFVSILASIV
jgi:hypothetical protein